MKIKFGLNHETLKAAVMHIVAVVFTGSMLGLTACTTVPDARTPVPLAVSSFTAFVSPSVDGNPRFEEGIQIDTRWWQAFGSLKLDALIEEALRTSPTLDAVEATVQQARHLYAARAGTTRYPQAGVELGGERKAINGAAMGQPAGENTFNLFGATAAIEYEFDFFGGNRPELDALAPQFFF